ncbi:MAG: hypothetical protein HXY40_03260 [Chloroflexi bacterium]|nr:hypothetical protein [Chloroflexota bacterium]
MTRWLLRLLPFLLAAALYSWALRLPFFSDDVLHFRYATQVQTLDIWTKADITGIYYRPVVNFILHAALTCGGVPLQASFWHLLMVWNHLINIALVGALARALRLPAGGQIAAMLVFALYPFSAQAVVWVLAWFHPLATTAALAFCALALHVVRRRDARAALSAAWLCAGIAPFIHENGVLAVPLLGVLALCRYGARGMLRRWRRLLLICLPPLLCALLYLGLRQAFFAPAPGQAPLGTSLLENLAVFAQGLSFPLQFAAARLPFGAQTNAWLGFVLWIMVCVFFVVWRSRVLRPLLASLGWWALASLPAALALTPIYVQLSERLLYIAAPGVALCYGALWSIKTRPALRALKWAALAAILGLSLLFVREQNALYAALGAGYQQMRALLTDERPTLLVNMPQQMDAAGYALPLTRVHAFMLHDYLALRDFVWLNTEREFAQIGALVRPDLAQRVPGYALVYYGDDGLRIADSARVILFEFVDGAFAARLVGERAQASDAAIADFGGGVRLEAAAFTRAGATLQAALRWRRLENLPFPYVAFVHLLCGETLIAQADGAPIGNLYDFAAWQPGETWLDYRQMTVGAAPDECLRLRVGLYDRADNTRAPAADASANAIGEWVLVPVILP